VAEALKQVLAVRSQQEISQMQILLALEVHKVEVMAVVELQKSDVVVETQ
jgi:hypothetical protein